MNITYYAYYRIINKVELSNYKKKYLHICSNITRENFCIIKTIARGLLMNFNKFIVGKHFHYNLKLLKIAMW